MLEAMAGELGVRRVEGEGSTSWVELPIAPDPAPPAAGPSAPPHREHPRPDLIVLNVNLPDISRDMVLEQLKRNPALREIPMVVISGDAIPSQIRRILDLGATAYVTKPFEIPELLRLVDESVGSERAPPRA